MNKNVKIIIGVLSVIVVISMSMIGFTIYNNLKDKDNNKTPVEEDDFRTSTKYINSFLDVPNSSFYSAQNLLSKGIIEEVFIGTKSQYSDSWFLNDDGKLILNMNSIEFKFNNKIVSEIGEKVINASEISDLHSLWGLILFTDKDLYYLQFKPNEDGIIDHYEINKININYSVKKIYKTVNLNIDGRYSFYLLDEKNNFHCFDYETGKVTTDEISKDLKSVQYYLLNTIGTPIVIHDFLGNAYLSCFGCENEEKIYKIVDKSNNAIKVNNVIISYGDFNVYLIDTNNNLYLIEALDKDYIDINNLRKVDDKFKITKKDDGYVVIEIMHDDNTTTSVTGAFFENPYFR